MSIWRGRGRAVGPGLTHPNLVLRGEAEHALAVERGRPASDGLHGEDPRVHRRRGGLGRSRTVTCQARAFSFRRSYSDWEISPASSIFRACATWSTGLVLPATSRM